MWILILNINLKYQSEHIFSVRKHPEEYQNYGGFYMPVKNNTATH